MKIFYRPSAFTGDATQKALDAAFGPYEAVTDPAAADLQIADYEELDFQTALDDRSRWICAYSIRKALIRKHFLSQTVREYVAKHPESVLVDAVPETWNLEVDFVEFLDDALDESFELRGELEQNEVLAEEDRKWFILKPGMAERGAGLRLFSTIEELTSIFEDMEPSEEDSDEAVEAGSMASASQDEGVSNGVMTSDMRFFVVQEYLSSPLLLKTLDSHKFHIRAYVLCIGSISVYVHRNMLILSSTMAYAAPSFEIDALSRHLTNTCYQVNQAGAAASLAVHSFWDVEDEALDKDDLWRQIKAITGDVFDAACAQRINFQTLPNAYEVFGLDYLVSASGAVKLLEVNAYPDFAQTGEKLKVLVEQVAEQTVELVAVQMRKQVDQPKTKPSQADYKGFECCLSKKVL